MAKFVALWVLAAAISWTALLFAAHGGEGAFDLAGLLAKFGPTLAGLIIIAVSGAEARRAYWVSLTTWKPWLMLALFVVAGAVAAVPAVALAGGVSAFSFGSLVYWISLRTFMGGGLGEEPGIRGVALPALLERIGPRIAALVIGVVWAAWHLPVLWGKPPLVWVGQLALTTSGSLILTFVWTRFGASVPVAVVFHGALNGWAAYVQAAMPVLAHDVKWQAARLALLMLIAVALLPFEWKQRSTR